MTTVRLCVVLALLSSSPAWAQATAEVSSTDDEAEPPKQWLLGLGFGGGGLTGGDGESFSQGAATALQLGFPLTPKLHLLFAGDYTSFARLGAEPDMSQQQAAVTLGVRWAPFESGRPIRVPTIDLSNFYVRGGLGVGHLTRSPYDSINPLRTKQGKWGVAATGAVGWAPLRGPGWALGIEASDSVVAYGTNDVRHNLGVLLMLTVRF